MPILVRDAIVGIMLIRALGLVLEILILITIMMRLVYGILLIMFVGSVLKIISSEMMDSVKEMVQPTVCLGMSIMEAKSVQSAKMALWKSRDSMTRIWSLNAKDQKKAVIVCISIARVRNVHSVYLDMLY